MLFFRTLRYRSSKVTISLPRALYVTSNLPCFCVARGARFTSFRFSIVTCCAWTKPNVTLYGTHGVISIWDSSFRTFQASFLALGSSFFCHILLKLCVKTDWGSYINQKSCWSKPINLPVGLERGLTNTSLSFPGSAMVLEKNLCY